MSVLQSGRNIDPNVKVLLRPVKTSCIKKSNIVMQRYALQPLRGLETAQHIRKMR